MNKEQYLLALNELISNAIKSSCEHNQELMIEDFRIQEEQRLELFNEKDNVGYEQELMESAMRYQNVWMYENNLHLTRIF